MTPSAAVGQGATPGIKVSAIGYGRTGTYSVALALNQLGYNTFHTMDLPFQVEILKMLHDTIFGPSIRANQVIMGEPDLQLLADTGFDATSDLPMALYYEQILRENPDCKFILTTRDSSQQWLRSFQVLTTSISNRILIGGLFMPSLKRCGDYLRWLHALISGDMSYLRTFPLQQLESGAAIRAYEQHNERVRAIIPKHQLLEFNVKEGWGPLCEFLQVTEDDCPQTPFPRSNSARFMQTQASAAFYSGILAALAIVFYLGKRLRRACLYRRRSKVKVV